MPPLLEIYFLLNKVAKKKMSLPKGDQINSAGRFLVNRRELGSRLGEILNASSILNQKLSGIQGANGVDTVSDISEVDETHKTFFSSRYIPGININYEYFRSPMKTGLLNFGNGNEITFEIPTVGQNFIGDMVLNLKVAGYGNLNGTTLYRYCDFPGVRMIKKATFVYDNVDIDSYTSDDVMFERRFSIDPAHRPAWDEGMGQESPYEATIYYENQQVRERRIILDGPQTPKSYQPELNLWIKLHFDFNNGISSAFFINQMTAGKREVRFELESLGNIFYTQVGDVITPATSGPSILRAFLYTQNIYVSDKIAQLYSQTAGFRVLHGYSRISRTITDAAASFKLEQLRHPTEMVRFGFRPFVNLTHPENWHKYTRVSTFNVPVPMTVNSTNGDPPLLVRRNIVAKREYDMISTVEITIKSDVKIYPELGPGFYHNHLQTRPNLLYPPDDRGSMVVTFNVEKNVGNDANGYLDLTVGDPLVITWKSDESNISTVNITELVISAKVLKVMLLQNGRSPAFAQAESLSSNIR